MDSAQLLIKAAEARRLAYAPYSKFLVGAALLTDEGQVFTGINVENASYGLTICAERAAVFKAVSEGHRRFRCLALSVQADASPCGACRQVLHEFAPGLNILIGNEDGALDRETSLDVLLPQAFGPSNLDC